jgi:hypothetical protein
MAPECWFCGEPIRRGEPAESLPHGDIAVHARCVQRDAAGGREDSSAESPRKAA